MAGGFFIPDGLSNCQAIGLLTATTLPTVLTTGAADTKGSYTQLTASTASDATHMMIASNTTFAGNGVSIDYAIGASGSEKIIVADWMSTSPTVSNALTGPMLPVSIPAGTRISARAQSTSASDTCDAALLLFDNASMGRNGSFMETIGFVSGTTVGTTVDPGATANTKGVYTQITASTTSDYMGFCFHCDTLNVNYASTTTSFIDVAIGASGSEQVIISNYYIRGLGGGMMMPPFSPFFEMPIRAGTRIAVRSQCTSGTSTVRQFGFVFYGLRG